MGDITSDLQTAADAIHAAQSSLDTPAEQSLGDKVLEAVLPVLEAAGYTAPAATETTSQEQPS